MSTATVFDMCLTDALIHDTKLALSNPQNLLETEEFAYAFQQAKLLWPLYAYSLQFVLGQAVAITWEWLQQKLQGLTA